MSDHGVAGVIELPIYIENDFEVDEDGVCSILTIIFAGEDEEAQEFRVEGDSYSLICGLGLLPPHLCL